MSEIEASRNPEMLNRSMKARRDVAWQIVARLWAPISPVAPGTEYVTTAHTIPVWMSWYEAEDIAQLYDEMLSRKEEPSKSDEMTKVSEVLRAHAVKDIQTSLTSARLGKVLRQFTFRESPGPHRTPGTGAIYYSPAYVRHILANAERIANCDPYSFPRISAKPPASGSFADRRPVLDVESVPASLRPSDPKNLYALCMDHEMPPDAVMVKTAWYPLRRAPIARPRPGDSRDREDLWIPGQHRMQMGREMTTSLSDGAAGVWIEKPWRSDEAGWVPPGKYYDGEFVVADEAGNEWALMGMHIAAKAARSWIWISLFPQGGDDWSWGADNHLVGRFRFPFPPGYSGPISGSIYFYGMCAVSGFTEGDPTPWAGFDHQTFGLQQGNAMRAVVGAMGGSQWCSNPYIETNMARGNCIGCHQGSPLSFLPTTVTKEQGFNISDFSFSFATNRAAIIEIRRRHGLDGKVKPKGASP